MAYSFLFGGNTKETPDTLSRKREMADLLASQLMGDTPKNAYEGIGAMLKGAAVGIGRHRDGKAEKAGRSTADDLFNRIIGQAPDVSASSMLSPGIKPASTSTSAGTGAAASVNVDPSIRDGIVQTASALGVDPVDLATAISYETAGTFDPTKAGPTTKWGKHRGLIQFGEPQAQQYGVNWDDPVGSQLGENGAVAKYLRSTGVKPGMGLLDIYSAINAGGVGRYNASDAAAGGAPGTVRDKVEKQMAGHRAKALALFGDQGQEVASLDPAIGMPPQTAAGAVNALAAGGGGGAPPPSLSEDVAAFEQTPEYQAQFPGRNAQQPSQGPIQNAPQQQPAIPPQFQGSQQLANAQGGIIPALMDGSPASPEQVAQAQAMGQQQAPQQAPTQARPDKMALLQALSNPWLSQEQKAVLQTLYQQQEQEEQAAREQQIWLQRQQYEQEAQRNDPAYQIGLEKSRIELEDARKPKRQPLINAGNGNVYDPNEDKWLTAPSGSGDGSFRFNGNSVEAQALNGLMESGQLTPEQAQQLAAGKTISGPNGEIIFLTPQGVFGQSSAGGQPQQMSGSQPASNQPPQQQMQPQTQMPGQTTPKGNIQITPPKVTVDEKEAATFADRMNTSGGLIEQFEGAGLGVWDQAVRGNDYIPDFLENWMVSDDFQNFDQARRDFINAQLRRESGAVISAEEFDNANKQYFPQPGDTKEVLEQKRRNRQTVVDGMKRSAGPTYGRSNNDGADPLGIR